MKPANFKAGKTATVLIQVLLWLVFYLMLLLYTSHKWDYSLYGVFNASISTLFYLVAAYGNSAWLIPRFLRTGRTLLYVAVSVLFLGVLIMARMYIEYTVLLPLHLAFYQITWAHFAFDTITILVAFVFGALMRVALNYMALLKQKDEIQNKQIAAELNLLKAQVQPHFLFNTLNNIYSLAQSGSPKTPAMIAKLSELMRYFIDESPKERIPVSVEMEFISNYIELEQIRMVHPVKADIQVEGNIDNVRIAPMLLMPFIENVFKHGIDKTKAANHLSAAVHISDGILNYKVINSLHGENGTVQSSGFGLVNLKRRLELLYPGRFRVHIEKENGDFIAQLQIPV